MASEQIAPFTIDIAESDLDDLHDRLRRTRWPDRETVDDWSQGVPLAYMREMCDYWLNGYDWRASEADLNSFPQFKATVDDVSIHFIHLRSPEPDASPLILTHGWPGSIIEFQKVLRPLADPRSHGGDPKDAFHVVCPSLPGYGFSDRPTVTGWTTERIASAWTELMHLLGYERFLAQGGDWGAAVTTYLGMSDDPSCYALHVNRPLIGYDDTVPDLTEAERATIARQDFHQMWGTGYSRQQSTRPQTLGYGLSDSPVGQAAWVLEKFWAWTDCDGDPSTIFTKDELLDNVMMYWLTGTATSSARLYWESFRDANSGPVLKPTGISIFPMENLAPSRRWVEKRYQNIQYWNDVERGGHFPAMEQPELFIDEVRACFRELR